MPGKAEGQRGRVVDGATGSSKWDSDCEARSKRQLCFVQRGHDLSAFTNNGAAPSNISS